MSKMESVTLKNILEAKGKRPRELSLMQLKALTAFVENGGNKGAALREAGYGSSVVSNPDRVFGSVAVQQAVIDVFGTPDEALNQLKRKVKAKQLDHLIFPPFIKKDESEEDEGGEENDYLEKRGEQLTDEQICEMIEEVGCKVRKIVHGERARHIYFWTDNHDAQLVAIEKVINLFGLYAPKRVESKSDHRVGVFSLADLRQKMKERNIEIIPNQNDTNTRS